MPQAANALFTAANLACRRGERLVFSGLHFDLAAGQALILRGPNGSGKSSLLRLLAGLGRPETGRIDWRGTPISRDSAAHRARLHFVGHADAVKPALLVAETLSFWAHLHGGAANVPAALAHFRLARLADLPCRFLSAGERKRLALARLLASAAELWLLDEPTNGLDTAALDDLLRAVTAHCADGGIAVVASHLPLALDQAATLALDDFTPRGRAIAA